MRALGDAMAKSMSSWGIVCSGSTDGAVQSPTLLAPKSDFWALVHPHSPTSSCRIANVLKAWAFGLAPHGSTQCARNAIDPPPPSPGMGVQLDKCMTSPHQRAAGGGCHLKQGTGLSPHPPPCNLPTNVVTVPPHRGGTVTVNQLRRLWPLGGNGHLAQKA